MPVTRHKMLNPALIRLEAKLGKKSRPEKPTEPEPAQPTPASEPSPEIQAKEPDELLIAIREAVLAGEVTSEGKPSTRALSKRLGRIVSAEERDRAFEDYQARSGFDAGQWC